MTHYEPQPRFRPRRAVLMLLPSAIPVTLVAAVAGWALRKPRPDPYPDPDPGNLRVRALAADPVFAGLPPGATRVSWQVQPAKQLEVGVFLSGRPWEGPFVALKFTSPQPPADVYRIYARRAAEAGWTLPEMVRLPGGSLLPGSWTKNLTGKLAGNQALLSLDLAQGTYTLFADPSGSSLHR